MIIGQVLFRISPYQKKGRKICVLGGSADRKLANNHLCCGLPVCGES